LAKKPLNLIITSGSLMRTHRSQRQYFLVFYNGFEVNHRISLVEPAEDIGPFLLGLCSFLLLKKRGRAALEGDEGDVLNFWYIINRMNY